VIYLPYVQESIFALGLIKPEFDTALAIMLETFENQHPKKISVEYRKLGEQLSLSEKRALGLRANTFYSKEALESLTFKGLERLIDAHEVTMLRAVLAYFRDRMVADSGKMGFSQYKVLGAFKDCPGCRELDGEIVSANHAANIRPNSCAREACALALMPWKDHLAGIH
jgi:hypothetical protein